MENNSASNKSLERDALKLSLFRTPQFRVRAPSSNNYSAIRLLIFYV